MQRVSIMVSDSEEVGGWILSFMLDAPDIPVTLKRDEEGNTWVVRKIDSMVIGKFPQRHPFNQVDIDQLKIVKHYVLGNPSTPLHPNLSLDVEKVDQ